MDFTDVREKYNKRNKLLFSRDSTCLQDLLALIREQNHRTLVLWALECVQEPLIILKEKYPDDERPQNTINLCGEWAEGKIKMSPAKAAILETHTMAKELKDPVDAALCHAIGQGCSTVHVETHAIGLPIYELTAIVRRQGIENCNEALEKKIKKYMDIMRNCEKKVDSSQYTWAKFLLNDSSPNKEMTLSQNK